MELRIGREMYRRLAAWACEQFVRARHRFVFPVNPTAPIGAPPTCFETERSKIWRKLFSSTLRV